MKKSKFRFKTLIIQIFIIYAVFCVVNQQVSIIKLKQKEQEIKNKIQGVAIENERLKALIKSADTDEYTEKMAREQLGLVKPGEKVYIDQASPEINLRGGGN